MNRIAESLWGFVVLFAAVPGLATAATATFDFTSVMPGTIADASGNGVGLTTRLPETGGDLPASDPNMTLNTGGAGTLTIMTTANDLNGQANLGIGEYVGIELSSLGYTGSEDFSITATFQNSVFTENFDQFGIIIGAAQDISFRVGPLFAGGPVIYASPNVGVDAAYIFDGTFAPLQGDDITLHVSRQAGVYSYSIDNLTNPGLSGDLVTPFSPSFLNLADDLMVGVYAASSANTTPKPVTLDFFEVTVGPISPPAHPGDFDGDGDVDGADFVAWQTNFPTQSGAAPADGDADGDGDVDGADFVVWQTNFPFTPGSSASPVPEPAAAILLLAGGMIALGHRRMRRL